MLPLSPLPLDELRDDRPARAARVRCRVLWAFLRAASTTTPTRTTKSVRMKP
ncbi:hypothetical protein [Streptomyces sp. A012304]|uniref:hypothetical protein n=1 Tax=Streptomyces sp. A012304 TaxID=375446 RepID=UPI002232BBAF|nr:hypothetical protein [Streptomyces sp. A012304]